MSRERHLKGSKVLILLSEAPSETNAVITRRATRRRGITSDVETPRKGRSFLVSTHCRHQPYGLKKSNRLGFFHKFKLHFIYLFIALVVSPSVSVLVVVTQVSAFTSVVFITYPYLVWLRFLDDFSSCK